MYCNIDEAYDLKNTKKCVHDQIIDDSMPCQITNMFDAQGEYHEGTQTFPSEESIFEYKPYKQYNFKQNEEPEIEHFANIYGVNQQINGGTSIQELKEQPQEIVTPKKEQLHNQMIKQVNDADVNGKTSIKKKRHVDISDHRDEIFIIFLGIAIIFTLDMLVRLGRNL